MDNESEARRSSLSEGIGNTGTRLGWLRSLCSFSIPETLSAPIRSRADRSSSIAPSASGHLGSDCGVSSGRSGIGIGIRGVNAPV